MCSYSVLCSLIPKGAHTHTQKWLKFWHCPNCLEHFFIEGGFIYIFTWLLQGLLEGYCMIFLQFIAFYLKKKHSKGSKKKMMDLVQLTRKPPPPPAPPPNVDYVFFSPLFYRSFPIFRHIFYIKSKKNK